MVAAAGGNSKDITIRFTGQNLLGPVARSVQAELDKMVQRYRKAASLTTAEVAKRAIAQRDAWMKPFMEFEKATTKGWVRFGSAAEAGFARAGKAAMSFGAAAKKAMGGLGLAAGMVGDLAGSDTTTGKAIGAVGNIAGQAALGGMAAGPWGAVAFGAVAAVKELKGLADVLKDVETNAAKAKAASVKSFLDRRNQVVDEAKEIRQGIVADRPLPNPGEGRLLTMGIPQDSGSYFRVTGLDTSKIAVGDKITLTKELLLIGDKTGFKVNDDKTVDALRAKAFSLGEIANGKDGDK